MKRREVAASEGSGIKPFLDVAFDKGLVSNGEVHAVERINESKTKAGYVLHCDRFMIHLYKSSPMADVVVELAEEMCRTNPAPGIVVEIDEDASEGFHIGDDESPIWQWSKTKKFGGTNVYTRVTPGRSGNRRKSA